MLQTRFSTVAGKTGVWHDWDDFSTCALRRRKKVQTLQQKKKKNKGRRREILKDNAMKKANVCMKATTKCYDFYEWF